MNKYRPRLYLLCFLLLSTSAFSQSPFEKVYGGANPEKFQSVIVTSDGGILACGDTKSFGLGDLLNIDGYIVKLNSDGDTLWTRTFGSVYNDEANQVMENSFGYLVAGHNVSPNPLTYDYYLVQYDFAGNKLWEKFYVANGTDYCYDALISSKKQIVLAGGTNSFTFGGSDFYIVVTDSNGNFINQYNYGGTGNEIANAIIQTNDSGFILVGYTNTGTPGYNIYVVKIDSNFVQQWTQNFGGINDDIGWDIQKDENQNLWILGFQETQPDSSNIVLIKTDAFGNNPIKYFPGAHAGDYGFHLNKIASHGFVITGYTNVFGKGSEMFFERLNTNGDSIWAKHFGGTLSESGFASAIASNGDFIIAGETNGFGNENSDAYLVRIDSNGNIPCPNTVSFKASNEVNCEDQNVFFTNTTLSSQSFLWSIDGNDFSNAVNANYFFNQAGSFNVVLSSCNVSLPKNILVNSKPAVHFTYSTVGTSVDFILDPGISVQSISWNFGDGSALNTVDENPSHTYPFSGMYWVIVDVTNTNGCDSTYIEQINVITGVEENSSKSVDIFPNPSHESISITGTIQYPAIIKVYDFLGRELLEAELQTSNSKVDLNKLSEGMFTILLTDHSGAVLSKRIQRY